MRFGFARSLRFAPRLLLATMAGCGLVVLAAALLAPAIALRAWLVGFVAVGDIVLGSAALLAIHALTGGRWGSVARPAWLLASAGLLPGIAALAPLLLAAPSIYPWAADPASAGPGVAALYLNPWGIGIRSLVLIGTLRLFASACRRGLVSRLAAGLTLALYGILMNLLAFDWVLSLTPRFNASAFGMQMIVGQIVAGLGWAILTAEAPADDPAWADLGALLFAAILGEGYLILMSGLIEWYGDLPAQAAWYLNRSTGGWQALEVFGILVGIVGPLLALLFGGLRRDPARLRLVACAALAGLALEAVWLIAPSGGGMADLWTGVVGLFAWTGLACLLFYGIDRRTAAPPTAATTPWEMADGA